MRKYSFDSDYFLNINIESAYWAGFIAADGCIRNSPSQLTITLSIKDIGHLENFKKCIKYTGKIKTGIIKNDDFNRTEQCNLTICGIKDNLANDLNQIYNIYPKKSLVFCPNDNLPLIIKDAFIKGMIDGDGTIYRDKQNRLQFSICGTGQTTGYIYNRFNEIANYSVKHHAKPRKRTDRTDKNHFTYKITGYRAEVILSYLHKIPTPELDRKWNVIVGRKTPKYKKYLYKFY